jgi:hypothetical protein
VLFPWGGGDLSAGQAAQERSNRAAFWTWLLAVLAGHALMLWVWRQHLALDLAPVPRLQVSLVQPMRLQAPPPAAPIPALPRTRRLSSGNLPSAAPGTATLPGLEPLPAHADLAALPAVVEPAPVEVPAMSASAQPDPEWPLSSRLVYALVGHYQGPVHGDAEVEWLRQGDRYQMRLRVSIGPKFAPFMSRELVSSGRLTPDGIRPERYDEDTRILFGSKRRVGLTLDHQILRLANGRQLVAPEGVQDSASQFVQLAWWFLTGRERAEVGRRIELPLALPFALRAWRYEVVERVELDTPLGRRGAWHLRPEGVDATGALLAQVWLAPELQYLPLRIRIEQGANSWVELTLQEAPLQEAAPAENGASQASKKTPP